MGYDCFSITAYEVVLSKRTKGINGLSLDELRDKEYLINDPQKLYHDFIKLKGKNDLSEKERYFVARQTNDKVLSFAERKDIDIKYGCKTGIDFSVLCENESISFSKDAKIIKPYKVYFYLTGNKIYMVALKYGQYSCKTAVEIELKKMFYNTNIIVSVNPLCNTEYVKRYYGDYKVTSIMYETLYKVDDGDLTKDPKKTKDVCNKISINMTAHKNMLKYGINKFVDFLTQTTRDSIIAKASVNIDEDVELDTDSLKVEICINKYKKVIPFKQLESLLYEFDITNLIEYDSEHNPILSTVEDVINSYMKEIVDNDRE